MTDRDLHTAAALFDPTRMRIARQALMLRKKELAELVGVSPGAISHYENGTSSPSIRVVAALALALGMPPGYFAADRPLGEAPATTAHFRSLRSTSQQERDQAFAHALTTWELTTVIQRYIQLPDLDLPDLSIHPDDPTEVVEERARDARAAWGLSDAPIPNVIRLLESRGVVCTRLPPSSRRVFAFSCDFPGRPVVVLSTGRSHRAVGRFDAAHELAHLVLHHGEEAGTHAVERQANVFASEFLAPGDKLVSALPARADWRRLTELKAEWGISIQALLYRARSLGVMTENVYRRAVTELSRRGWRQQEPGDDGIGEDPVLLRRAIHLMANDGTSLDDLAVEARIPVESIELIAPPERRPRLTLT